MDMKFYWKLLVRRLPVMAALFLICAVIGVTVAYKLPTTYVSTARMLLEAPRIPSNLAASTVQTSASEDVELVRQQLLTRANLIEIANQLRVFSATPGMSPDEVVAAMRSATQFNIQRVSVPRGTPAPVIATLSFQAGTAQTAAAVVNEYTTRIIDANARDRTERAGDTLEFFQQEVERLSGELETRNAQISAFQAANPDAMPGALDRAMIRQTQLNDRNAISARDKAALLEQREQIIAIYEATGQVTGAGTGGRAQLSPAAQQLQQLEAQLAAALAVYSETNPRVLALKTQIEQARAAVAAETGTTADAADPAKALLDSQIANIDQRIATIDDDVALTTAELERLAEVIERAPQNIITLDTMSRDYANVRAQYDRAVQSLAQARLGERIEFTSRGQRITLIEPAAVPNAPASPNRPLIAAMGVGAGLALAGAYFVLLEMLNRTVRRPSELTRAFGIAPLATIPFIETALRRRVRRTAQVAAILAVMIGVPAALWAVDTYYLPLDLLVGRLLDRIGLA